MSVTRASVRSTLSDVRSAIAASRFGRLDGLAYQSPPPSYWSRATVRRVSALRAFDAVSRLVQPSVATANSNVVAAFTLAAFILAASFFLLFVRQPIRHIARHPKLGRQCLHDLAGRGALVAKNPGALADHGFFWWRRRTSGDQHNHLPSRRVLCVVRRQLFHRSAPDLLELLRQFPCDDRRASPADLG